jgi:hypothetical protein
MITESDTGRDTTQTKAYAWRRHLDSPAVALYSLLQQAAGLKGQACQKSMSSPPDSERKWAGGLDTLRQRPGLPHAHT